MGENGVRASVCHERTDTFPLTTKDFPLSAYHLIPPIFNPQGKCLRSPTQCHSSPYTSYITQIASERLPRPEMVGKTPDRGILR